MHDQSIYLRGSKEYAQMYSALKQLKNDINEGNIETNKAFEEKIKNLQKLSENYLQKKSISGFYDPNATETKATKGVGERRYQAAEAVYGLWDRLFEKKQPALEETLDPENLKKQLLQNIGDQPLAKEIEKISPEQLAEKIICCAKVDAFVMGQLKELKEDTPLVYEQQKMQAEKKLEASHAYKEMKDETTKQKICEMYMMNQLAQKNYEQMVNALATNQPLRGQAYALLEMHIKDELSADAVRNSTNCINSLDPYRGVAGAGNIRILAGQLLEKCGEEKIKKVFKDQGQKVPEEVGALRRMGQVGLRAIQIKEQKIRQKKALTEEEKKILLCERFMENAYGGVLDNAMRTSQSGMKTSEVIQWMGRTETREIIDKVVNSPDKEKLVEEIVSSEQEYQRKKQTKVKAAEKTEKQIETSSKKEEKGMAFGK